MNYTISVIIPCYNSALYIDNCLESILKGNCNNIEIICIDDNSIDNTVSIIEKYKKYNNNIKLITNKTNLGAGIRRNQGAEVAKGEWILYCDSDDWFEQDFINKLNDILLSVPSDINIIEFCFNLSHSLTDKKKADWLNRGSTGTKLVKDENILLATGNGNKLYRKSFLEKYELKNAINNMSGEEIPMHICAFSLVDKFYYFNEIGYNWRVNAKSASRNKSKEKEFLLNVFKMTDFLKFELIRLGIYNENLYHQYCRTIYNWHIKEKANLNMYYIQYYLKCNNLYKKWGLKQNKPILLFLIKIILKKCSNLLINR